MRKLLLVLVLLFASSMHAQPKTKLNASFDYSKFEGLWYNENTVTLFVWKEKGEFKVAEFSTYSGHPLDVLSFSMQDGRMYVESLFRSNAWYTSGEYTYQDDDTLSLHLTGDGEGTELFTRYDFKTYNPPLLQLSDEN